MVDLCRRCGAAGPLFPIGKELYCRRCFEMSFRVVSRYRLLDRRDPRREPRGYGRRFTDRLTESPRPDDS
ncbi:MAG TPA: hypothetical protein VG777_03455 [Thermoanaerobaculia bacterium]|nr:hypothetical protein [Thermoanaerobaculia bacterium]